MEQTSRKMNVIGEKDPLQTIYRMPQTLTILVVTLTITVIVILSAVGWGIKYPVVVPLQILEKCRPLPAPSATSAVLIFCARAVIPHDIVVGLAAKHVRILFTNKVSHRPAVIELRVTNILTTNDYTELELVAASESSLTPEQLSDIRSSEALKIQLEERSVYKHLLESFKKRF